MFQTESLMLVALGFGAALAITMIVGMAVWTAADRWSASRRKKEVPTTILDMQAEREQLRAEHAMTARRLEVLLEKARAEHAEQAAEVSRHRNRTITVAKNMQELDAELSAMKTLAAELTLETNRRARIIGKLTGQPVTKLRTFSADLAKKLDPKSKTEEAPASAEETPSLDRIKATISELHTLSAQIARQQSSFSQQLNTAAPEREPVPPAVAESHDQTPAAEVLPELEIAEAQGSEIMAETEITPIADGETISVKPKTVNTPAKVVSLAEKFRTLKGHAENGG